MFNLESNTNLRVAARRLNVAEMNEEVVKHFKAHNSDPSFWVGRSTSLGIVAAHIFFNKGASAKVAFKAGMVVASSYYAILHSAKSENVLALVAKNTPVDFPAHCIADMADLITKYIDVRTTEHTQPNITNFILKKVRV